MQDPIYSEIEGRTRPTLFAASGLILLAAVGLWAVELALALLPAGGDVYTAANLLYYLPFALLPAGLCLARRPALAQSLRLNPLPLSAAVPAVLLALMSVYAASALTALWQALLGALGMPALGGAPVAESSRALTLSIVTMAALPAVCEELLFRGFALAAWETRGTRFALGVTAALFALLHGNVTGLPAYLLVGGVSANLVVSLDSLYAGIVYHTVYNAACLVIPYLLAGQAGLDAAPDAGMALAAAAQCLMTLAMMAMLLAAVHMRARLAGRMSIPRIRRPLATRERLMLLAAVLVMLAGNVAVAIIAIRTGGVT